MPGKAAGLAGAAESEGAGERHGSTARELFAVMQNLSAIFADHGEREAAGAAHGAHARRTTALALSFGRADRDNARMNRSAALLCILLATIAGCERESEPAGLPQSRFIEVMVELRRAARGVQDTTAFAARKQQILTDAGVTEEQLRAYLATHMRDLDHLAAVWESINVRLAEEEPR